MTLPSRPVWQTSPWFCALSITLIFLAGAVTGAIAMSYRNRARVGFYTEAGKIITLQRWQKELNLSPDQTQEIKLVLDDFAMYYVNVIGEGKGRILKVLNEEQKQKFQRLMQEAAQH